MMQKDARRRQTHTEPLSDSDYQINEMEPPRSIDPRRVGSVRLAKLVRMARAPAA